MKTEDTSQSNTGIVCPKCGSRKLPAFSTRRRGNNLNRVRKCKKCGHKIGTQERVTTMAA